MQDECYNIVFRKKIYNSLPDLQIDIDHWLRSYNETRPHSGKHCYGKTPMQTFLDTLLSRKILNQDSDSIFKFF
ncbi:MAG: hypothetical protein sGL2_11510 [Candidatus Mesenet longicola]|nr:MAG: hypothetical protein sGL2_11510 [Candidatus Mesenet longicola]